MPLPSSPPPPPSPLLLPFLCFCWAMGSTPANPNPPMAVTSAAPLLPVAGEHHLSSLSLSSTSPRASPLSLTRRTDKGQPWRCGNDPCDGGIDRGFLLPHARSHPPSMAFSSRLGQPQRSVAHSMCRVYLEERMDHIIKLLECIKYGMVATSADCSVDIRSRRFWTTAVYLPHCLQCFGHLFHFILNYKMDLKREGQMLRTYYQVLRNLLIDHSNFECLLYQYHGGSKQKI